MIAVLGSDGSEAVKNRHHGDGDGSGDVGDVVAGAAVYALSDGICGCLVSELDMMGCRWYENPWIR